MDKLIIDHMLPDDWKQVLEIYLEGMATGNATFQKEVPSWEEWNCGHLLPCRIVARSAEGIVGWAALSPVSSQAFYAGVAEVSIYINQGSKGKGVGSFLLASLVKASEQKGFWTLQSKVFPENTASLGLHNKFGFRQVGRLERIGQMNGVWRDVLLLERRSTKVGND